MRKKLSLGKISTVERRQFPWTPVAATSEMPHGGMDKVFDTVTSPVYHKVPGPTGFLLLVETTL